MALSPTIMTANIVAQVNATPPFNISAGPPQDPTYTLIQAACSAFVPVWVSMFSDMAPGAGPPPAGVYPHAHSFLGTNLAALTVTYETSMFTLASAPGKGFQVPPQPPGQTSLLFFTEAWSSELLKVLDSVQLTSNVSDGGAAHDHKSAVIPPVPPATTHWATLNTQAQIDMIANSIVSGMETTLISKHGAANFNPNEPLSEFRTFATVFTKGFLTEIRNNSVMIPVVGAGHVHGLL